ncbi:MAG: hypothetical protein OQL19_11750 [Gammaproteobacteria bacterium]|nr:hypothetical protein [Gammaproteobacteria bacterium]
MQIHLKKPVEITVNGKVENSEFLNIEEPNRGNLEDFATLSEIASAALMTAQSLLVNMPKQEAQESNSDGFDTNTALMMLKMGGKYKEAIKAFDIFLLKYGKFDETKVQSGSLNRLDIKDYDKALGGYFAENCFLEFTQA